MLAIFRRDPDFVITRSDGEIYLRRWWVIPRNRWFNIYLHHILADDDDRALHDHPWVNCSIVLKDGYDEITPKGTFRRKAGSIVFRRAVALHRLVVGGGAAWTLFITGRRKRDWGFQCPQGWVVWWDFVDPDNPGTKGPGCGQ